MTEQGFRLIPIASIFTNTSSKWQRFIDADLYSMFKVSLVGPHQIVPSRRIQRRIQGDNKGSKQGNHAQPDPSGHLHVALCSGSQERSDPSRTAGVLREALDALPTSG